MNHIRVNFVPVVSNGWDAQDDHLKISKGEVEMTRKIFPALAVALAVFLTFGIAYAQQGQQKAPSPPQQQPKAQQNGWYCPWCGSYGGPHCSGMMQGYGMGPGMMQRGHGMGAQGRYGMGMRYGQQGGQPLSEAQIKNLLHNYVAGTNNPNLKVGKITKVPGKDYYVAEITTKDGSLVDKIDINEYTGWFRSAYAE